MAAVARKRKPRIVLQTAPEPEPKPEHDGPRLGVLCPACGCGGPHFVIASRPTRSGYTWRRRECRHCGKRFTTSEQTV